MAVTAYQVNYNGDSNGYVPAIADRRLYNSLMAVSNSAGFVQEPTITVSGLNVTVTNGWGIIYGCEFLIDNEAVSVSGVAGTYLLILRLNVTTSAAELVFVDSSTSLVQEDINNGGSIYEMAILQCVNNGTTITEHTVQYTVLNTNSETISSIQTTLAAKTNTKVKGNAETTYRAGNVNLTPANIGAVPTSRTVNGKALSSNVTLSPSDIGAVPTTRKINGVALSSDIELVASDVWAVPYWTTNLYGGALLDNLETIWDSVEANRPNGGLIISNESTNDRYLAYCYKVAASTGILVIFDFKATSSKAKMRVFLRSSGTFTEYDFTSD